MSSVILDNRSAVYMAKEYEQMGVTIYKENDKAVFGFLYQRDGYYTKHFLKNDLDNIARFICCNHQDKLICNTSDLALASTMGTFLDIAVDSFREKILPYLMKYQMGAEVPPFEELE